MTGICGWLGRAEYQHDKGLVQAMAAALSPFDGDAVWTGRDSQGVFAAKGRSSQIDVFDSDNCVVALCGTPRIAGLEPASRGAQNGLADVVAAGYERLGLKILDGILGSFALALLDKKSGTGLLAVDRTGVCRLYYEVVGEKLLFGSKLDAIAVVPGTDDAISSQTIYDYVYSDVVPGPETIYRTRKRLMPGTFLSWRNGVVRLDRYWTMRFKEDEPLPFAELKHEFLRLLREAVANAARGGAVGTFLSGGTDSSTIAGILGEVSQRPARTYSIGFDAQGYDEMRYARIAAGQFRTVHHEYYVTPADVVDAIPLIAGVHDEPFGNSSAVPAYYCARLAKQDGIDVLLGGDGGDELFGGNARYARQYVYSLYSELPAMIRGGIEPLMNALPRSYALLGKVQRYIRTAAVEMPARYNDYNLVERLGAPNIFSEDFLAGVDAAHPKASMAAAYNEAQAESLINRMLAFDLRYTLADNDLPKVTAACELAGVDVGFPLLDDALVAFSARLAPRLKLRGTTLRYFFKKALADFLPAEIIGKKKHGFGLPFGVWLQSHGHLAQLARDNLSDLKARGIIRPDFIDQLLDAHMPAYPHYYGNMVWVLMMLEQWFKQHAGRARCMEHAKAAAT